MTQTSFTKRRIMERRIIAAMFGYGQYAPNLPELSYAVGFSGSPLETAIAALRRDKVLVGGFKAYELAILPPETEANWRQWTEYSPELCEILRRAARIRRSEESIWGNGPRDGEPWR